MTYDFDAAVDRRNTNSLKWDVKEGELPMWVADMDFTTAPPVREALARRVEHGVFGYSIIPDEWNEAYANWWKNRHGFAIRPEWLVFATGVVPAISSAVRKLTTPGENVLIQTPVYNIFFNSIVNNGRNVLECPLEYDADKPLGQRHSIDYGRLEECLANPQTTLMILCNPHNPVGRIWSREELATIGDLCARHDVVVISDEIHCDLTAPGLDYVPFASVSDNCRNNSVTCIAPTKAFNIAGLQTAAVMVPNRNLRHKVWRQLNTDEVAEPNALAVDATIAAFNEGGEWLDQLRAYIQGNKEYVADFLAREIPSLRVSSLDATYLLWIDCGRYADDSVKLARSLRSTMGLYLSEGAEYGGDGCRFVRLNVATTRANVVDGCNRLAQFFNGR